MLAKIWSWIVQELVCLHDGMLVFRDGEVRCNACGKKLK